MFSLSQSNRVLQCVAVCCSVLQYVAVRVTYVCSCFLTSRSDGVLQRVAEWCSALQYFAVRVNVCLLVSSHITH